MEKETVVNYLERGKWDVDRSRIFLNEAIALLKRSGSELVPEYATKEALKLLAECDEALGLARYCIVQDSDGTKANLLG